MKYYLRDSANAEINTNGREVSLLELDYIRNQTCDDYKVIVFMKATASAMYFEIQYF